MSNTGKKGYRIPHWADAIADTSCNPFKGVEYSTLLTYSSELGMLAGLASRELTRIQQVKTLVDEAIRRSQGPRQIGVHDHAIVRYLQRYKGLDLDEITQEIRDMNAEGRPEIAFKGGVIVTILPEGQQATSDSHLETEE